jgi:hypothetical protein
MSAVSRRVFVIAVVLAAATAGGCGGSDEASDATTTDETTTAIQTSTDTQTTTTDQPSAATWTEFGATVDDWNSAHESDTNYPAEGCCYLPGPKSAGGRYGVVLPDEYDGGLRVGSFSIFWDDESVPLAVAEEVVRQAAPPGARRAFTIRKNGCVMIEYRSPALTRALYKGAIMLAALYSPGDQPSDGSTLSRHPPRRRVPLGHLGKRAAAEAALGD